jgi:hypothetical protein
MKKMSAYDFCAKGGPSLTASAAERAGTIAFRLRQFAQDVSDGKALVYTIDVHSAMMPNEVVKTVLTISFTEINEDGDR